MPAHIIVGAQWGDEGKGRVADWYAAEADIVARYAGGNNAGHTVRVGDDTFKLHLIPSGVLHEGAICVMGNGMVIDPIVLMGEIQALDERGVDVSPDRLRLSKTAHIITPAHIALDGAREANRGDGKIGTTKRGIGPVYTDKAARIGLRTGAMGQPTDFAEALGHHLEEKNTLLETIYGVDPVDIGPAVDRYHEAATFLAPYLADTARELNDALEAGKNVLCEGAQGTLLDIDHGGYPYVTSSNATAGGALTGLGIGPKWVDRVIGIAKSYTTRVGSGPFPTELDGPLGDQLRGTGENPWDEYGTTTGRPRRCGWLDAVILRYARCINGLTELVITKLDILSGFETLEVASAYEIGGDTTSDFPLDADTLAEAKPVTQSLDGWAEDIMGVRTVGDLPQAAQGYVKEVETLAGVPVSLITVGPARSQTIIP